MKRGNRRRQYLLPVLASALLLVLAACAAPVQETGDVAAEGGPSGGQIVLRVGTGDSGEGLKPHQEIIRRFEAANPDIKVQLEPVSGSDYYARLLTQIVADDAPDIMNIGDDAVPQFVAAEAFLPLDDFIAGDDSLDTSVYLPGLLEPGQWDGRQWFLPKDYSPLGVYYNKKIFDEYGVAYPEAGWTWDDLVAIAGELTKDTDGDGTTDLWGIQLPGPWTTGFEYWVAAAGGSLISEDGSTFIGYMDSPETTAAVQFYQDLYQTYKVAPLPADMSAFGGGNSEFDNGQAAMRIFGRWPQSGMLENPNIDLGVVGTPADAVDANVLFWGGFGIYSGTEYPEAAWRFLKFYAGPEGAEVWQDWALPAVASVAEEAGLNDDPIEGAWLGELDRLVPRAYVFTPYWGQAADPALRRVLETVILDPGADAAELTAAAAQEAQAALETAQEE
ncbi:MAG: sugar ABC transporter substrate-binding protein [Caldilineaceae bacterium]|nr:sugar ABC transporter substrate-binding protein [Caldilineaceae bacterium]